MCAWPIVTPTKPAKFKHSLAVHDDKAATVPSDKDGRGWHCACAVVKEGLCAKNAENKNKVINAPMICNNKSICNVVNWMEKWRLFPPFSGGEDNQTHKTSRCGKMRSSPWNQYFPIPYQINLPCEETKYHEQCKFLTFPTKFQISKPGYWLCFIVKPQSH